METIYFLIGLVFGSAFMWVLCAAYFEKVSKKIGSYMDDLIGITDEMLEHYPHGELKEKYQRVAKILRSKFL